MKSFLFFLFLFGYFNNLHTEEILYSNTTHYTIQETLKDNEFSRVFLVRDANGKQFVIKTDPNYGKFLLVNDLEKEYAISLSFDHPNIVKSIELFVSNAIGHKENKYLVLEYIEGNTLASFKKQTLSRKLAIRSCIQVMETLNYALSEGFIWDDFNHNNFILKESSDLIIIDLISFKPTCSFSPYLYTYLYKILFFCQEVLEKSTFTKKELKSLKSEFSKILKKYKKLDEDEITKLNYSLNEFLPEAISILEKISLDDF